MLALIGSTTRLGPAYPHEECFKRVLVGLRVNIPGLRVIGADHTQVSDETGECLRKGITRFNGNHAISGAMKEQGGRDSVAWRAFVIECREIDTRPPRSEPLDHIGKPVREVKLMHLRIYSLVPIKYWCIENNGPCLCNVGRATQEGLDHEAPH